MRYYLFKRLFLALPVLLLLATLLFILSRLLPGTYASESILQEASSYYEKGNTSDRDKAYQQYLVRTGQNLPLFYFSVTSKAALPDTLLLTVPTTAQRALQQLSWQCRDWRVAYSYWQSVTQLQASLSPLYSETITPHLQVALLSTDATKRIAAANNLKKNLPASPEVMHLYNRVLALQQQQNSFGYILPNIQWYGTRNQYHVWLFELLKGDFGTSYRDNRNVTDILATASTNTIWIILISMVLTTFAALTLSIKLVQNKHRQWRRVIMPLLFLADGIPLFIVALLFLILFANPAFLQLFPVFGLGYSTGNQGVWEQLSYTIPYLVLPILSLSFASLPYLTNQFYNALTDEKKLDYARTAQAKGLAPQAVVRKHILRNALLPIITLLSDFLPGLIAGSVVIETIFAIPGMGRLLVSSVQARDYPVLIGIVVLVALAKVISHVVADVCYAFADPRIRYQNAL